MRVLTYSDAHNAATPSLFSQTRDFEFLRHGGQLVHRLIPPGPKGFKVVSVITTGHAASFVEKGRTAVTLPQRGRANVQVGRRKFVVRPGEMIALGPSERRSRLEAPERNGCYESFTIIAPANWPFGIEEDALFHRPDPKRLKLQDLLRFSFEYLSNPQLVSHRTVLLHEALVEDALVETLHPTGAGDPAAIRRRSVHLADKAAHFIEESFTDAITVPKIAAALGVSLRTLQKSFRAGRGMTLRNYLAIVRLDAMRRRLDRGASGTSVTSAALESGLFHLGRTSEAYRKRFGELPSDTLRRASPASIQGPGGSDGT